MNAMGSCELRPKSMLESTWDTAAHPATPASPPINTGRRPEQVTVQHTDAGIYLAVDYKRA